jgi:DNA-binding NarL/FixJ family response regulator
MKKETRADSLEGVIPAPALTGLLETLELLLAQSRAYERALPRDNYPARAAVATLGELAQQAYNEAQELTALVQPVGTDSPCSPRELTVLQYLAEGLTNKEIAYHLGISERTVQFHINSLFNKTGSRSRTELVALALRRHWLPPV